MKAILSRPGTTGLVCAALLALTAVLATGPAVAQSVSLTPQQQLMLNQLPPAQRQQALDALRQMQGGQTQTVGQPLTESADVPGAALPPFIDLAPEFVIPRAAANSRLVISFTLKETLTRPELSEFEEDQALARLEGSQTFVLDDNGILVLPGIQSIPLLGLGEDDIELRLSAEPALAVFDIEARVLESQPTSSLSATTSSSPRKRRSTHPRPVRCHPITYLDRATRFACSCSATSTASTSSTLRVMAS
jgi:hypothetical protein